MTKIWNSLWDSYKNIPSEQILNEPAGMSQRSEFVGMLLKHFDLKGKSILEVGTGTGQYSIELAKRGAICTGIDIEQESIDLAKRIAKDCKSTAQFQKGDLFDAQPTSKYDIVFSMGTIEHFTDKEIVKMFRKMSEIADYVVVGVPYRGSHAYMLSKQISMQMGTWEYGVENDFMTLDYLFEEADILPLTEKTIGAVSEAMYLKRVNHALIPVQIAMNLEKMYKCQDVGSWLISIGTAMPTSDAELKAGIEPKELPDNEPPNQKVFYNREYEKCLKYYDGIRKLARDLASCPDNVGLKLYKVTEEGKITDENLIISKVNNPTEIIPVFYTYYKDHDKRVQTHAKKELEVLKYAKLFNCDTLIETGTYLAEMPIAMKDDFKRIYSIELDFKLADDAIQKCAPYSNITILQGDSGVVLKDILKNIDYPCLFWLDGHYSYGVTAKGKTNTPIITELDCILNHNNKHVILIDDAREYNGTEDYPTVEALKEYVLEKCSDYKIDVKYDMIRIKP